VEGDGASATDEDSMIKAMCNKAAHNLDAYGTEISSKSFLSFSPSSLSLKLNNVRVSFGSNNKEVGASTRVLRHMEFDCLTVVPKTSTMLETTYVGNNLFR
jgi:hypothetical protein